MFLVNDLVMVKINEWLNGSEDSSLFKCVVKEMVSIEIFLVIL